MNKEKLIKEWEELGYIYTKRDNLLFWVDFTKQDKFVIAFEKGNEITRHYNTIAFLNNGNFIKAVYPYDRCVYINSKELDLIQKTMEWLNND